MNILHSPLEQFQIKVLFTVLNISLTNQILILLIFLITFFSFAICLSNESTSTLYIIPSRWQSFLEILHINILKMITLVIKDKSGQKNFPIILSLFTYIACLNLLGLIPYTYTITSQFIVTLAFSYSIFIGIAITGLKEKGFLNYIGMFLPAGTPFALSFILVPIEIISYACKPLSLGIRLFCNMIAGHILLQVISGFAWVFIYSSGIIQVLQIAPLLVLFFLFCLEILISLVQAFIFSLLVCMYLNEVLTSH